MIDVLFALAISVAMVAIPAFGVVWLAFAIRNRSIEGTTEDTSQFLFGLFVSLFAGFALTANELVSALGSIGDVIAQFPNLLAYGGVSVASSIGLNQLLDMSLGVSILLGLVIAVVIIMVVE